MRILFINKAPLGIEIYRWLWFVGILWSYYIFFKSSFFPSTVVSTCASILFFPLSGIAYYPIGKYLVNKDAKKKYNKYRTILVHLLFFLLTIFTVWQIISYGVPNFITGFFSSHNTIHIVQKKNVSCVSTGCNYSLTLYGVDYSNKKSMRIKKNVWKKIKVGDKISIKGLQSPFGYRPQTMTVMKQY